MAKATYPTLQKICDAHAWKREYEKYLPLSRFVFRPIGFLLTWLAIRIGLSSQAVSWLSGLVGLIAYLCLMSSQEPLLLTGIGLLCFSNLLDCVDGSIVRVLNTESPYGSYLDFLMNWIDMGFWALIGIMAYRHPQLLYFYDPMSYGPIFWLAVGGLACYLFNYLGYVEGIFDKHVRDEWNRIRAKNDTSSRDKSKDEKVKQVSHRKTPTFSIVRIIHQNITVRETRYFLLLLAYWGNVIDLLLAFFLFYYIIHTISLIIIYHNRGRQIRLKHGA